MARIGLVGPSYQSQAMNAACQLTMNWYPEVIEPGNDKVPLALYPTPGTRAFAGLGGPSCRGLCFVNGRLFAVSGAELVEVDVAGTATVRGAVADDGRPARFAYTDIHLVVAAGSKLYVLELATNTFTALLDPPYVRDVVNIDGFFIALCDKRNLRISQVYNALSWPGAQIIAVSVFYEDVVGIIAAQRELGVLGSKRSVIYQDTGSAQIFDVVPGSLIEQGLGAEYGHAVLDNTGFWLGQDAQGAMVAYRLQGYTPVRISTHAIELAWQGYSVTAREGAVTYAYQDVGHLFWVVQFPGVKTTWVYDVATQMWHERAYLRVDGQYEAHHSWCHAYAWGKHLVGDWSSGRIYELSIDLQIDADTRPIRRARRATHLSDEEAWSFHHRLQVDLEAGLGPQPPLLDGAGNPRAPQLNLRWSDDGGHTWTQDRPVGCGLAAEFRTRALWNRLGRTRNRVYEINASDPVPWRVLDAYLRASAGNGA